MIKFAEYRKVWYLISLLVIIPGMVVFGLRGLNLGVDFKGGNLLDVRLEQQADSAQVREVLDAEGLGGSSVQAAGEKQFLLRTPEISEAKSSELLKALQDKFGKVEILRNEKVGAVIGQELTRNAVFALLIASVLMVIYITIRFEFLFAIAAIAALLHDVLVVLSFFAIFQLEVDSGFVAALLTIIGYSINDTIVIFDRIRENLRFNKKEPLNDLVNKSVTQTLRRSINTAVTVIIALVALLLLGGETTRNFALAMLVGTISGAYSSIFNASPLWIDFRNLAESRRRRREMGKPRVATAGTAAPAKPQAAKASASKVGGSASRTGARAGSGPRKR